MATHAVEQRGGCGFSRSQETIENPKEKLPEAPAIGGHAGAAERPPRATARPFKHFLTPSEISIVDSMCLCEKLRYRGRALPWCRIVCGCGRQVRAVSGPGRSGALAPGRGRSPERPQSLIRSAAQDRMLDMGFEPQIRKIISGLPQDLFSAALHSACTTSIKSAGPPDCDVHCHVAAVHPPPCSGLPARCCGGPMLVLVLQLVLVEAIRFVFILGISISITIRIIILVSILALA